MIRVPFEVELAKRIQNKECEGRIVTRDGRNARIVCWDKKSDSIYNIVALLDVNTAELIFTYSVNGFEVVEKESDNNLFLEIPEYMTFKDGDVIAFGGKRVYIGIYKCANKSNGAYSDYVVLNDIGYLIFDKDCWIHSDARFATEEEKQKLIDALKANKDPNAKECLKKLGVEVKQEYEFKPKDWVLGKSRYGEWCLDIFSHKEADGDYVCIGSAWDEIIPYNEETAHLLGTTQNYE